jgi:hypothetical protein
MSQADACSYCMGSVVLISSQIYLYLQLLWGVDITTQPKQGRRAMPMNTLSMKIQRGKYHCTIDLLFDWFGLICFANKNKNCQ